MACHILFPFFLKYVTNSEGMVSSWCVPSKFTLKNPSNIALPWQHVPAYRSHIVHCHVVLFLHWHVVQMLGSISISRQLAIGFETTGLDKPGTLHFVMKYWAFMGMTTVVTCPKQALQGLRPTFGEVVACIQTLCVIRLAAMLTNTFVKQTNYVTC